MTQSIVELIAALMTAISNCTLYSKDHPAVHRMSEKAISIIDSLYKDDSMSLTLLGENLHVNDTPVDGKNTHVKSLIRKMKRRGIEKVLISKGLTVEELKRFLAEIALSEKIAAQYPHISAGIIELKLKSQGENIPAVVTENAARVREIYRGFSQFKKLDTIELEDIMINFTIALKKEMNVLHLLLPVKSYNAYTYAHTTNVSLLSVFQAEYLGLTGEILYDIGLAGLLHDIGKLYIPSEILDKQSRLDQSEWSSMKRHPFYGALYLSSLSDIPKITLVAAFEHHCRFDGTGYPKLNNGRKQHIVSQIVSIADFFDALRTHRPYRKPLEISAVAKLLLDSAGTHFNPLLVNNFISGLKKINALPS